VIYMLHTHREHHRRCVSFDSSGVLITTARLWLMKQSGLLLSEKYTEYAYLILVFKIILLLNEMDHNSVL